MTNKNDHRSPEFEFLENLFGNLNELRGDDLDIVFEVVSHVEDPAAAVQALARKASREYRERDEVPPPHVKAATAGTRGSKAQPEPRSATSIVKDLLVPERGAVSDPAFAWRDRAGELGAKDQKIVEDLEGELRKDWSEEE